MEKFKIFVVIVFTLFAISCSKDINTEDINTELASPEYLVFGHHFGFCMGEGCIEIYKLEGNQLFEDSLDNPPNSSEFYNGSFYVLDSIKYNLSKDLIDYFPDSLLIEDVTVFGCPNCYDQGALYVEYNFDGIHKFWLLDRGKLGVPNYLHDFIDKINEKIQLIKN